MTYGIFNLDSGNLIDCFTNERQALSFVADMLKDGQNDPSSIGLVTPTSGGVVTLSGNELRDRAESAS